jgi:hypothetical protein
MKDTSCCFVGVSPNLPKERKSESVWTRVNQNQKSELKSFQRVGVLEVRTKELPTRGCALLGKLVCGSIALAWPRWRPSVCIQLRSRGKTLRCTGANKTLMPLMPYEFRCAGMIPCGGANLR